MSVKIHNTKDFTLGIRGGDWYAFPNTAYGRVLRKSRLVPMFDKSKFILMAYIGSEDASYETERESVRYSP